MKKTFIVFVAIVLVAGFSFPVLASITTTITANDSQDSVTVSEGTDVAVVISLEHSESPNLKVDYWAILQKGDDFYHLNLSTGLWESGIETTFQGAILNLPEYPIFQGQLPVGDYIYYFGVDTKMNGQLDMESIAYDFVNIKISTENQSSAEITVDTIAMDCPATIGSRVTATASISGLEAYDQVFSAWIVKLPDGSTEWSTESGPQSSKEKSDFKYSPTEVGNYEVYLIVFESWQGPEATLMNTIVEPVSFTFDVIVPATVLSGNILSSNLTLEKGGSPYYIDGELQIPDGISLNIEPGVHISGGQIKVWGELNAFGTAEEKIIINNVSIEIGSSASDCRVNLINSEINTKKLDLKSGCEYTIIGSEIIKNPYLITVSNDTKIEKSNLIRSDMSVLGGQFTIKNNNFIDSKISFAGVSGLEIPIFEKNSIYNKSANNEYSSTISVVGNRTPGTLSAINNYWGTNDPEIIESMIFDSSDDYNNKISVDFDPFLEAPDSATPDASNLLEQYLFGEL